MLAIYTRVSTEEQVNKGISLDNQELRGKELAAKLGLDFKVYSDAGLSGTLPFNKRPALNALIDDIYSKKITSLFVFDLNRLSRGDIIQVTGLKNIFKGNNVKLYELNGEIDLNDINTDLLTDMRTLINAFYIKQTSATIKSNLEKNVKDGKVTGGPLLNYGYGKDSRKMLIIDEVEADVVRLIYKLALEGNGTKVIANVLNERNIPTKRGNVISGKKMLVRGKSKTEFVWRDAVIYRILTGTIYKGIRRYKGNDYPYNENIAIIDETTFNLIQDQLKNRDQFKNTTNKYEYLLKGLIDCPVCGGKFYGKKRANGKDNAYTCNSNRYGTNCGNRGISIDYLDELVVENIMTLGKELNYTFNSERLKGSDKDYTIQLLDRSQNDVKENQIKMRNLLALGEAAGIEPVVFKDRLSELQKVIDRDNEEIEYYKKDLKKYDEGNNFIEHINNCVLSFKLITNQSERRDFIRNIVKSITIGWDNSAKANLISIYYKVNQAEDYIISKELILDRNTRKNGKALTKVITDKIALVSTITLKEDDKISSVSPFFYYGEHHIDSTLKYAKENYKKP
jgi:site-specific DNA recombinase